MSAGLGRDGTSVGPGNHGAGRDEQRARARRDERSEEPWDGGAARRGGASGRGAVWRGTRQPGEEPRGEAGGGREARAEPGAAGRGKAGRGGRASSRGADRRQIGRWTNSRGQGEQRRARRGGRGGVGLAADEEPWNEAGRGSAGRGKAERAVDR